MFNNSVEDLLNSLKVFILTVYHSEKMQVKSSPGNGAREHNPGISKCGASCSPLSLESWRVLLFPVMMCGNMHEIFYCSPGKLT